MIKRLPLTYSPHKFVTTPEEHEAKIWRYMDFTKFVSLLDTNALFFCRADHFADAWEGAHTVENVKFRPVLWAGIEEDAAKIKEVTAEIYRSARMHTFMNCWHLNEVESAAMWKLYVSHNEGIAIQSTYERLTTSFEGDESEMFRVSVGTVKYLDYEHEMFPDGNTLLPFFHKRLSFEHERELRAIVQPITAGSGPLGNIKPIADGLLIDVNLQTLIENIYVAPTCEPWFVDLVKNIAIKYGIKMGIQHSDLARDPVF